MSDYEQLISNVIGIFEDLTKIHLDKEKEAYVIEYFAKRHKWANYEFRLIIQHQFVHDKYLQQAGRMNLRAMLNPTNEHYLVDIVNDLISRDKMKKAKEELKDTVLKVMQIPCQWNSYRKLQGLKTHKKSLYEAHCRQCLEEGFQPEIMFSAYEAEKIWEGINIDHSAMAKWFQRGESESLKEYIYRTHSLRSEISQKYGIKIGNPLNVFRDAGITDETNRYSEAIASV